ncbi:MAG TPA: IS66 family transposase [Luteibaculaceae bacterium]|nr:IS66 family transposase [Luteibaculaceae bacterium]
MTQEVAQLQKMVHDLIQANQKLQAEVDFFKRQIFGKKSERFIPTPGQLVLEGLDVAAEPGLMPSQGNLPALSKPEKQKPVRKPIDESKFEVITQELHPEVDLEELAFIGVEESSYKVLVDAKIVIKKIKRYKYQKPSGEIIIADMPYRPFAKSAVSSSIVSEVLVQKYVDAMPIYRQEKAWNRLGVDFAYSSLSDMQTMGYDLIKPLFEAFKKSILASSYLQVDESPFKVLSSEKKGASHLGYQWVYLDPVSELVFYNYQRGRSEQHPLEMLKDFKGIIQTDGYAGYNKVAQKENIEQLFCMAHARRYFERALSNDPDRATFFLEEVKKLYLIESHIKEKHLQGTDKTAYRQRHAKPVLELIGTWLDQNWAQTTPKSTIGKAIQYSRERWQGLSAYVEFDHVQIDNNAVERSIRPMVVGRKNYLFAGSDQSAERAACFYSFFITCRMHNVNPKAWVNDVFEKIEHLKPSQYHTLFPQNWGK